MDHKTRLRKACDACSIRKVKVGFSWIYFIIFNFGYANKAQCDTTGPPCRSCASLDIPCTYDRPSRRRGPPNRHAEALKKQKLGDSPIGSPTSSDLSIPPASISAVNNITSTLSPVSAESICSLFTLQLLVDDYFTYIHPLVPLPHEPTFRAAFERREDVTNPNFLALLASMIGTLVASFPRRPKLRLKTEAEKIAFPHSVALVKQCHDVAVQARGTGYLDRNATVYDAAISYFLGLCAGYIYDMRRCRIYLAECQTMIHVYDLCREPNRISTLSPTSPISSPPDPFGAGGPHIDIIQRELGRRLFYTTLVGFRTLEQMGSRDAKLYVPPETPTELYPPLPLEVDDAYIFSTHVEPQPAHIVSQLVGFNVNVQVYSSYNTLSAWEAAFGSAQPFDWERQRTVVWECLQKAKATVVNIPNELLLQLPLNSPMSQLDAMNSVEEQQRHTQYEIQKANIYASQLATRFYLVEKYWHLYEARRRYQQSAEHRSPSSPTLVFKGEGDKPNEFPTSEIHAQTDYIGKMMTEERRLVIGDLLVLLRSVNEINMEPNGASFVSSLSIFCHFSNSI